MRLAYIGAIVFGALTIISAFSKDEAIDPFVVSAIAAPAFGREEFLLLAGGEDAGCRVSVFAGKPGDAALAFTPACSGQVPVVADAKTWHERADGSVALLGEGDRVLAEFAASDGAALESYRPITPVMTLLAL